MACHAPSEDMEDDDRALLAAAQEDDALAAKLLIRLSRSETHIPWGQLPELSKPPPTETKDVLVAPPLMPPTRTWGKRRARSSPVVGEGTPAAKTEEAGHASPATPLSWSGASGTSGSGSEDGWSTPPRPPKRRGVPGHGESSRPPQSASKAKGQAGVCHGEEEQIGAPPAKGTPPVLIAEAGPGRGPAAKRAEVGRSGGDGKAALGAASVVGSPAGSISNKAAARGVLPSRLIAHVEPSRSRVTGEGVIPVVVGRQGKKKTVPELRAMTASLLQEQEGLREELAKQKEMYDTLLKQNVTLKKLESSLPSLTARKTTMTLVCGDAKTEESHHQQSGSECQAQKGIATAHVVHGEDSPKQPPCKSSFPPVPARAVLFDLNCIPDGDL